MSTAPTAPPPYEENPAYPPGYQGSYPPQQAGYPPQQAGYPPQQTGYPPKEGGYPPPQGGYPPPQGGYPPPQGGYPPQGGDFPANTSPVSEPLLLVNAETGYTENTSASPRTAEAGGFTASPASFDDKKIRHAFIRKVYLILSLQLAVTFVIVCIFFFVKNVRDYVQQHQWLYWVSYVLFLVTYITLACCGNVRRKYPANVIGLSIFTLALSYMAGAITSFYYTEDDPSNGIQTVVISLAICVAVVFSVTLFSIQTRFDFTGCGGFLFVFSMSLFVFGFIVVIMAGTGNSGRILYTVYAWLAAVLFTMFLAYDTQLIVGGRRHEISPEEYIYGAMQLYVDIVYIFIIILTLFGGSR